METLKRLNDPKVRMLLGLFMCLLAAVLLHVSETGEWLNRKILDDQFALLHKYDARPVPNDVVIVGIDDASYKAFKEPFALWHPHLGKFLQAMAVAKPAVLGLDIVLPARSYQFLIPQYDQSLLQGLQTAKAQTPLVLAQTVEVNGSFRSVYEPLVAASGGDTLGSVLVCPDNDGFVRRFDPNMCTVNAQGTMFVDKMAAHLGNARSGPGMVDFAAGEKFEYISFNKVLEWQAQSDSGQLIRTFGGRPVILGVVSSLAERVNSPVPLAAWDPFRNRVPGVLMQAQMLRSMMAGGLVRDADPRVMLALTMIAALFWLGRIGWLKLAALLVFPVLLLFSSTWLLGRGLYLPPGTILFAGLFAFVARLIYEGVQLVQQRNWLRGTFGSYVSQEVLQEIMAGNIHSGLDGARIRLCILFADIHGFGARSESRPPQEVVALLNDYFSEMTVAIHQHKGTVDKFIGDGIMAFFGAPQVLECPEKNALEAAQEMLLRLRHVNARLQEKGIAPIEIGIALHVGEVVIGHIGSALRHEYTAIGDAVSLTAKLEDLTKTLNFPVVCTAAVAKAVENSGGLADCGEQSVKGGVFQVYGWKPPLLAER
ncbi:MAG: adenylate/guanylate cyclase domain-containing protein [Nitrosomonadales bacterium]|nr:adenylate/guanylate cyclase domain-containing protein [Nitrosomonadales bacterium]